MNTADRITSLRKAKGISQEELADRIGVSRQAVSKWESEQSIPDIDKIIILSEYFEVTTDYILKGVEEPNLASKQAVDAYIFVYVATALNFIGLLVSATIWYETQRPVALLGGLIFMAVACMIYGVGNTAATLNKKQAKKSFWSINIWILDFIPLFGVYNLIFARILAPYPLLVTPMSAYPLVWLIYIILNTVVVLLIQKSF